MKLNTFLMLNYLPENSKTCAVVESRMQAYNLQLVRVVFIGFILPFEFRKKGLYMENRFNGFRVMPHRIIKYFPSESDGKLQLRGLISVL